MGKQFFNAALISLGLSLPVFAQADAESDIAYRKAVMTVVGGHMKSMGTILKGGIHADQLAYHANGMRDVSILAPDLFPAGSGDGKTDALPEIWSQPEDFNAAMDRYLTAANGMAEAAATGEMQQIGPAMQKLGQSCKGCHDDYKASR